ncbi:MFS transporter [Trujillonella humicola]|uniref:MFS transporter n=1 Tax=Trujillonella humicola TaxID=3383699 RepID=UPI003906D1C5
MSATGTGSRASHGMFRSLRVRNYRLFASANLVSLIGTWMQRIGQDWLVLQLSDDSGIALGVVTALQFGPGLLLGMYGGVLADRYPKRRLLVVTQSLMGVVALALGLLVTTGAVALWHVFALAAVLGSVSAIDLPVRQSFVSEMVGPELLTNAVGLNSTVFNGARLVGPAVAGLLIAASSGNTGPAFLVNAASFVFTVVALLVMRGEELFPGPAAGRARGQLRAGLAYTWSRPDLLLALVLAFLMGTFGLTTQITIALMARQEFDLGAGAFGLLTTFFAVGSLAGALVSARRSSRPTEGFLVGAVVVFGLVCATAGLMPGYAWFAAALVPTGAAAMAFTVAANTFVQLGADPQLRGRVMALYFLCLTGGLPLGSPLVGWVAEHLGAPWAFVLNGGLLAVAGLVAGAWLHRRRRTGTRDGVPAAGAHTTAAAG